MRTIHKYGSVSTDDKNQLRRQSTKLYSMSLYFLSFYVACILSVAGVSHAANSLYFLNAVSQYELFPFEIARWISVIVPWIEIGLASGLLLASKKSLLFVLVSVLALGFVLVQVSAITRGLTIDSGCFGSLHTSPIGSTTLAIAISLLASGVFGSFLELRHHRETASRFLKGNRQ